MEAEARGAPEQSDGAPEVSVVIPCLNEAETLGACVDKARRGLEAAGARGEVVVADNGSSDGSQEIAAEHGARVVAVAERGYGGALQGGIAAARGRYVVMGDADDSYDFTRLAPFVERLRQGFDLVMGNRFAGGIAPGAMPALHRYFGNPFLSGVGRLFFGSPVGDFQCGLRGFRREAILTLGLQTTGMEFATEMVVKATLGGLRIAEVPTTLSPDGRSRRPHLRSWRDGWRYLRFLLLYSPRWLFLYPGAVLMALGLAMMVAVLPGPLDLFGVSFDIHTLLYGGAAVVIGYQAIIFAVSARLYAMTEGFLPDDPALRRLFRYVNLEVGLACGAVLLAAGLGLSIWAVAIWGGRSFGDLDFSETLRIAIPAVVLMTLGCQTIFSSFFLSLLGLKDSYTER